MTGDDCGMADGEPSSLIIHHSSLITDSEQPSPVPPFEIKDCALITIATGIRAANVRELRDCAQTVTVDSIYHHFWSGRLKAGFEDPEYHNDFAIWAYRSLHDSILAERLSVIDPLSYATLEDLRQELIEVLEERLDEVEQPAWAPKDRQFEFMRSQTVIFATHRFAVHPRELESLLPHLSVGTIFYHFIDSRRRNLNGLDDFRNWMQSYGDLCGPLCDRIKQIDPYFSSLSELREALTAAFHDFFAALRGGAPEPECPLCEQKARPVQFASAVLQRYAEVVGEDVIEHLRQLSASLRGRRVVHVNSTRVGGGVAEILYKMVPLMRELGLDAAWEVIGGNPDFFQCTKSFHNALQGDKVFIPAALLQNYEETNARNAETLAPVLNDAELVVVHDPQPAALISHFPNRKGKWIWRCHIDLSRPYRPVWRYLRKFISQYDASIFSLSTFAQPLPHPIYLIAPSIDPLNDKNVELDEEEVNSVRAKLGIDANRPMILQVSRYDRFKDPLGVIEAYKLAKKFIPRLQLVLAGGEATDDPEGAIVLNEVRAASIDDPDIHVLLLPAEAHRTINALQRMTDIVLQKSTKEGFGLTVTEALWKNKPVIGGNTGGIRLQVINHHTGFLVDTPEGAALRIRYLYKHRELINEMGRKARRLVTENFLVTRDIREHLTLFLAMQTKTERIELG